LNSGVITLRVPRECLRGAGSSEKCLARWPVASRRKSKTRNIIAAHRNALRHGFAKIELGHWEPIELDGLDGLLPKDPDFPEFIQYAVTEGAIIWTRRPGLPESLWRRRRQQRLDGVGANFRLNLRSATAITGTLLDSGTPDLTLTTNVAPGGAAAGTAYSLVGLTPDGQPSSACRPRARR
jgi:hypothetical protein